MSALLSVAFHHRQRKHQANITKHSRECDKGENRYKAISIPRNVRTCYICLWVESDNVRYINIQNVGQTLTRMIQSSNYVLSVFMEALPADRGRDKSR